MLVHNLYIEQLALAISCGVLLVVLLVNIWLLSGDRQAFLSPTALMILANFVVLQGVVLGQLYSIYWMYPLMAGLPVLLRLRRALVLGLLAAAVALPVVILRFDTSYTVVIACSMATTWLASAWLMFSVLEQSRQLRDMAITDPLTGAYNRRYLLAQARHAMESWRRHRRPSALLLIDVDYFKRINDQFGHAAGDEVIKKVVQVISARTRCVDTVCRFGGEEFVVLLQETGLEGGVQVAEALRLAVQAASVLPEGVATISVGVCEVMLAEDVDQWFKRADAALYRAKRNGRNRVETALERELATATATASLPDWR